MTADTTNLQIEMEKERVAAEKKAREERQKFDFLTGGPAWPPGNVFLNAPNQSPRDLAKSLASVPWQDGMTVLDWFAGQVIASPLSDFDTTHEFGRSALARSAYEIARAMVEEKRRIEAEAKP